MDKDDQVRVFLSLQKEFKVEDITPEVVNEFLNNKSGTRTDRWTEYIWRNGVRTKNTRPRERKVNVRPSSKKDAIAKKMGAIGELFSELQEVQTLTAVKEVKTKLEKFPKELPITTENKNEFENLINNKSENIGFNILNQELRSADTIEEVEGVRQDLENFQIDFPESKKTVRQIRSSISQKERNITNKELRRERGRALVGLSKTELSLRGINSRTTVNTLVKRYDLTEEEANKIFAELEINK